MNGPRTSSFRLCWTLVKKCPQTLGIRICMSISSSGDLCTLGLEKHCPRGFQYTHTQAPTQRSCRQPRPPAWILCLKSVPRPFCSAPSLRTSSKRSKASGRPKVQCWFLSLLASDHELVINELKGQRLLIFREL